MYCARGTTETEAAARQQAERLIAAYGNGAWDMAVQRAWESGGKRDSDLWWRVVRIVERRIGIFFRQ